MHQREIAFGLPEPLPFGTAAFLIQPVFYSGSPLPTLPILLFLVLPLSLPSFFLLFFVFFTPPPHTHTSFCGLISLPALPAMNF